MESWDPDKYMRFGDERTRPSVDLAARIASTGLRPFLEALDSEDERLRFLTLLRDRVVHTYPQQKDGRVLFPFRRTFVVAYRP